MENRGAPKPVPSLGPPAGPGRRHARRPREILETPTATVDGDVGPEDRSAREHQNSEILAVAGQLVAMVPAGTCTDRAILKWQFRMVLPTRFLPNR